MYATHPSWRRIPFERQQEMRKRTYTALSRDEDVVPEPDTPAPMIHNIVCTAQLQSSSMPLPLPLLNALLPGSFYDKRRFAAMTVRFAHPHCTVLLFSSGKLVVTGGRSWYDCVLCCLSMANTLRRCLSGHEFWMTACDIQNIVAHVEIPLDGARLNLPAMYSRLNLFCTYQKSMFPGLIYRPPSSPIVLLCFDSGKVVITGGRTIEDVVQGWARLWSTIRMFVTPPPPHPIPPLAPSQCSATSPVLSSAAG
jgi:transcription initiation factor TFIID TATA-box-binding protein